MIIYTIISYTCIFEVSYSEKLEQPLRIKYHVSCPNVRLDNTTIDDVLDKINEKGIESLDDLDKRVLSK